MLLYYDHFNGIKCKERLSLNLVRNLILEICLMSKEARRIATVRAKTNCDLYSLSRENFEVLAHEYPYMRELIKKVAELRLKSSGYIDNVGNVDPEFW